MCRRCALQAHTCSLQRGCAVSARLGARRCRGLILFGVCEGNSLRRAGDTAEMRGCLAVAVRCRRAVMMLRLRCASKKSCGVPTCAAAQESDSTDVHVGVLRSAVPGGSMEGARFTGGSPWTGRGLDVR
jgi:hypothetical protein